MNTIWITIKGYYVFRNLIITEKQKNYLIKKDSSLTIQQCHRKGLRENYMPLSDVGFLNMFEGFLGTKLA